MLDIRYLHSILALVGAPPLATGIQTPAPRGGHLFRALESVMPVKTGIQKECQNPAMAGLGSRMGIDLQTGFPLSRE
jgi:hypothetical protein